MSVNDGGPAFPVSDFIDPHGQVQPGPTGMTLRDYFAAQALAGYFAAYTSMHQYDGPEVAQYVYRIADAMLAQREKKK